MNTKKATLFLVSIFFVANNLYGARNRTAPASKPSTASTIRSTPRPTVVSRPSSPVPVSPSHVTSARHSATPSQSSNHQRPSAGQAAAALGGAALVGAAAGYALSGNSSTSSGHSSDSSYGNRGSSYYPSSSSGYSSSSYPAYSESSDYSRSQPSYSSNYSGQRTKQDQHLLEKFLVSIGLGSFAGWGVWSSPAVFHRIVSKLAASGAHHINPHNAQLGLAGGVSCFTSFCIYSLMRKMSTEE